MAEVSSFRPKADKPEEIEGFGCGAVVQLKSGGVPMTVRETLKGTKSGSPMVKVDWHVEDGTPLTADYYVDQLQHHVVRDGESA